MSNIDKKHKLLPNDRIDYSKISGTLPLPYLAEIQTESFNWFKEEGLHEVLKEVFMETFFLEPVE